MIKTDADYACLDFDHKNASRQTIFDEWRLMILSLNPEIYDKLFIEKTRNAGYHVWLKYPRLNKKLSLAESKAGAEVIALYAKGPLVYTFPTPGYTEFAGSMQDIQELTDREFELLVNTAQAFNEYLPEYDPNKKAVSYPAGFETFLSEFDAKLPDEAWQEVLNQIGLQPISNYRYSPKDKFLAYRRTGSDSPAISAKVYFKTKRVMIFSASLNTFPNWHNKHDYPVWSLPPSFVLFYKNNRDWEAAIQECQGIIDSVGLEIEPPVVKTYHYPIHAFPEHIGRAMIELSDSRSLSLGFVATSCLWTISSLAGTRYTSDFNGEGKNILFCLLVGPVSVGKTPAFNAMCEAPLRDIQEYNDRKYTTELEQWEDEKADAAAGKQKKAFTKKRPSRFIPIAKDGTTEGYIHKSMSQRNGIGVYQDEAETILNAGSFKSNNDSISFFTQAFSGGRLAQIRADETKERVVPNLNLNLLMGTQTDRLSNIFTADRLSSGFASRFLMVDSGYIRLNEDADPFDQKKEMPLFWKEMLADLYYAGMDYNMGTGTQVHITMGDEAKAVYRKYYSQLLREANERILTQAESYVIGTEAKMSAYFPRLTQILGILHNHKNPEITVDIVHKGWELYRFYADSTIRIIGSLSSQLETGLPTDLELLYQTLPDEFTRKDAADICKRLNLPARRFDTAIRRKDFCGLFRRVGQGKYIKI